MGQTTYQLVQDFGHQQYEMQQYTLPRQRERKGDPIRSLLDSQNRSLSTIFGILQEFGGKLYIYCWWTKSCTTKDDDYPMIYRVLTIPGVFLGFWPSTVFLVIHIWVFPKIVGKPPKWMVENNGKPYFLTDDFFGGKTTPIFGNTDHMILANAWDSLGRGDCRLVRSAGHTYRHDGWQ